MDGPTNVMEDIFFWWRENREAKIVPILMENVVLIGSCDTGLIFIENDTAVYCFGPSWLASMLGRFLGIYQAELLMIEWIKVFDHTSWNLNLGLWTANPKLKQHTKKAGVCSGRIPHAGCWWIRCREPYLSASDLNYPSLYQIYRPGRDVPLAITVINTSAYYVSVY